MMRIIVLAFAALAALTTTARAQAPTERTELWLQFIYPEERERFVGSMVNEKICEAAATAMGRLRSESGMKEVAVFVCRAPELEQN